jgi:hypothetical protein
MLTIMLHLVALFSGAKTLGWDTQKFGKCFEKPWEGFGFAQV